MATVVNARDTLLQATNPRTLAVPLPANIVVPTDSVPGLSDIYSTSKQIVLSASSLLFQIPKTGAVMPTSISMSAVLKNITGPVTFSVIAGTCSYSVNGNTITILPTQLTSTTATIQVSCAGNDGNTYTDVVTIAKVAEGVDSVVGLLSNESAVIATPYDGTITDFSKANGTFFVFDGLTNMTGNAAVAYSVVNPSGVTMSIAASGVYTVTAITTDTASATLRAVYTKNGTTVTIDKIYTVAKSKAGANSQLVTITADSQVFQIAKNGTVTPNTVNLSAIGNNLNGAPTFSITSGTAILTGTGSSRIMAYSSMSTDTVTVQVTWDGKTDTITIVKVREGVDSIVGFLTNESSMIPCDSSGMVTGSYSQLGGTFKIFQGLTDLTGNASVTYSAVNPTNMTGSIAATGVYTITGITADNGSITFRAVVNGVTVDKVYSLAKAKAGSIGVDGKRGNVNISYAITGTAWSDTSANAAISGGGFGVQQNRDIVTLYNTTSSYSETRFYDSASTSWLTMAAYISGNLLVDGAVNSRSLATGAVQAQHLAISSGNNIVSNSNPLASSAGWYTGWISNGNASNIGFDTNWCPAGAGAAFLTLAGAVPAGVSFDIANNNGGRNYPVKAGQRYELSAYISAHRCSAVAKVWWYNSSGQEITEHDGSVVASAYDKNTSIASFPRSTLFVTAPAGAVKCAVGVRGTTYADSNPYIFVSMLYFGEANPNQTVFSPWVDGGTSYIGPGSIQTNSLSAITANLGDINAGSLNINGKFIVNSDGTVNISSAPSGARMQIWSDNIQIYDDARMRVRLGNLG